MSKLLTMLLACVMFLPIFALPSYVEFSTFGEEPDTYADGTVVCDGEIYGCIWVKKGCTFAGIMADGQLVDSVNNKIIGMAALAENGHCKPALFLLNGENSMLPEGGTFILYLFDTRVRLSAGGDFSPAGFSKKGVVDIVNSVKPIFENNGEAESYEVSGEAVRSMVSLDAPKPIVKAIEVKKDRVILTIGNTIPEIRYTVESGATPTKLTRDLGVVGVNGTENGDMTLIVAEPKEHRFFKVVRED